MHDYDRDRSAFFPSRIERQINQYLHNGSSFLYMLMIIPHPSEYLEYEWNEH